MSTPDQSITSNQETDRQIDNLTAEDIAIIEAENAQLASELEQDRAAAARKAELRALIAKNAQLKQQKAQAASIVTPEHRSHSITSNITQSLPVERSLKFTPITSITDGRLDFYAHTIGDQPLHNDATHSSSQAIPPVSQPPVIRRFAVKVPPPDTFDGMGKPATAEKPAESVEVRLEQFIIAIEKYLQHQSVMQGISPSPEEFCSNACFYLTGVAAGVVNRLELRANQTSRATGIAAFITWPEVREALRTELGRPLAGHVLILKMMKLTQKPAESVDTFTDRFEALLLELSRQGLDSRDAVVAYYLNALSSVIRERVEETINMRNNYWGDASISSTESRAALAHLRTLAKARESFLASQKSQPPHVQRPAPAHSNQSSNHANSHSSNQHKSNDQSHRFERVPDQLFKDRMDSNLCGKCGAGGHPPHACPNKRSFNASTVPTKRSNSRFNVMSAVAETEAQHAAKQPQPANPSSTDPKNM